MAERGRTDRAADAINADILAQGKKMLSSRVAEAMPGLLEKMDVALFDLSEQAMDGELKRIYQSLQRELRERRGEITSALQKTLQSNIRTTEEAKSEVKTMALSLVDFDDMEESLGVDALASGLRNACAAELRNLDIRVAHLLGVRELRDHDNPFGPDVMAKVFKQLFSSTGDIKSRLTLLQLIGNIFPETLSAFYGELNSYLVSRGIVPEIKYRAKVSASTPSAASSRTRRALSSEGNEAIPAAPTGGAEGAEVGDLFASLQQLFMMNMGRSGAPGMPMHSYGGGGTAATQSVSGGTGGGSSSPQLTGGMPMQATDELLKSLTLLQRGDGNFLPHSAESFEPSQLDPSQANLLRNIRDAGLYNPASQIDAITIDVVAMLFDFVFDDPDIPAAVRALIGRLQIPVLKAAMLDKKFFSRKDNSARKLLDKLAQVSVAWSGDISEDDPLYQRIATVVRDVIDNFEENPSVFEHAVDQLEQYIAEEESQAEAHSKTTAEKLYKREIAEFAHALAQEEIRKRTHDVPPIIRQFLSNYWLDVLVAAYEREGEEGEAWKNALTLVDDLAWSMEPKVLQEDRLRLVRALPQLLSRIEKSMRRKSAAEEEIRDLSNKLVEFHLMALKGTPHPPESDATVKRPAQETGKAGTEPTPQTLTENAHDEAGSAPTASTPPPDEVETGEMKWTIPTKDLTVGDEYDRMAKQLGKGSWLEFTLDDGARLRVKLTWISPLKSVMLFTERDGSNAVKISPVSLAKRFRAGTAVILGENSLVERAVSNVMSQLMKNTGTNTPSQSPVHNLS